MSPATAQISSSCPPTISPGLLESLIIGESAYNFTYGGSDTISISAYDKNGNQTAYSGTEPATLTLANGTQTWTYLVQLSNNSQGYGQGVITLTPFLPGTYCLQANIEGIYSMPTIITVNPASSSPPPAISFISGPQLDSTTYAPNTNWYLTNTGPDAIWVTYQLTTYTNYGASSTTTTTQVLIEPHSSTGSLATNWASGIMGR